MRSYIAGNIKIQQFAAVLLPLGLVLGGCSQFSVPVGSNNVDTPTLLTGSIPSSSDVAYSDISVEDRKIIAEKPRRGRPAAGRDGSGGCPEPALAQCGERQFRHPDEYRQRLAWRNGLRFSSRRPPTRSPASSSIPEPPAAT
ncbi:hypothetical protein QW131_02535 [Roseibium salinum]|nr:hypothetical protein [Roseibium salinum]